MVRMKSQVAAAPIEYPSSDGIPMGETERHAVVTMDARQALGHFFSERPDVYVGIDMLLYWVEGDAKQSVAPDVFVVFGAPKLPRRDTWLVWKEGGKTPDFVLEVTSKKTRRVDEGKKRRLYKSLGVEEYWQFDPTGDYLDPLLKGARLVDGRYEPITSIKGFDGSLRFRSLLGLELRLERGELRFFASTGGRYLPTCEEAFELGRRADEAVSVANAALAARDAARTERDSARTERDAAREEASRLKRELAEVKARLGS